MICASQQLKHHTDYTKAHNSEMKRIYLFFHSHLVYHLRLLSRSLSSDAFY